MYPLEGFNVYLGNASLRETPYKNLLPILLRQISTRVADGYI